MKDHFHQPFKAQWQLYVAAALTVSNTAGFISWVHMILSVIGDYFLKEH
jgi:hypothetical protein